MAKNRETFIKSIIFLITMLLLSFSRLIFGLISSNISDNILNWLFSFCYQILCLGIIPFCLYKVLLKKKNKEIFTNFKVTKPSYKMILGGIVAGFLLFFATMGVSSIWRGILQLLGFQFSDGVGTIYTGIEVLILDLVMLMGHY